MRRKLESKFVRLVMPNATEAEIAEATQRWFNFLKILNEIAIDRRAAERDSHDPTLDDRVD